MDKIINLVNENFTMLITPIITLIGIYLTNRHNIKVLDKQNENDERMKKNELRYSLKKIQKDHEIETERDKIILKNKIYRNRLINILYPIIEIYNQRELEEQKSGYHRSGLGANQYEEIKRIIEEKKENKFILGSEYVKAFYNAEQEYIDNQIESNKYKDYQYGEDGFDDSNKFYSITKDKIKEAESYFGIY